MVYLTCSIKYVKIGAASTASGRRRPKLCRSGCHCTPKIGSVACSTASITPSGAACTACRGYLREQAEAGRVRLVIRGEDFSIFSEETRRGFVLCGQLRQDRDLDRENRGVTFILL